MTLHHFSPTVYYSTIGSHEPALYVEDGDSIATTTVDAWGGDASGQTVARGTNPMTGPFYVSGAQPGDALAVTFERIAPNRETGFTLAVLASNVVDPAYARELPKNGVLSWQLIPEEGTAVLLGPAKGEPEGGAAAAAAAGLKDLRLPLSPMLGCFGVAPRDGQAISTATSGPHGGNMDYRGFGQGATVYLPVAVEGALFFLGDGHAAQGDGEIVGTGIETSFDVQFTLRVIKNARINWPRGENEQYILVAGNARPLDQALQHATTEMLRWLGDDYGLNPAAASALMGQTVEYEIGNVFDPAYTVICKMRKTVLARLPGQAAGSGR